MNKRVYCPHHPDEKPSCVLSKNKKIYHCLSCGANGWVKDLSTKWIEANVSEAKEAGEKVMEKYGNAIRNLGDK